MLLTGFVVLLPKKKIRKDFVASSTTTTNQVTVIIQCLLRVSEQIWPYTDNMQSFPIFFYFYNFQKGIRYFITKFHLFVGVMF